jgi:Protein of unknown function (DUF4241)
MDYVSYVVQKNIHPMKKILVFAPALIFLFSCTDPDKDPAVIKRSAEPLDTIKTTPAPILVRPAAFEAAFINGSRFTTGNVVFITFGIEIGKIRIKSGKLITCDPLHIDEYGVPFTFSNFPTGEFPVQLAIAKLDKEETVAYARILFSNEPVVRWEMALQEGQRPVPFGQDDIQGFSTDTWSGIYIDTATYQAMDRSLLLGENGVVYKEMDRNRRNHFRYAMYNFGEHNFAIFSTGYRDGYYASYIGYDAKGNVCRLLSDFDLFDWRKK